MPNAATGKQRETPRPTKANHTPPAPPTLLTTGFPSFRSVPQLPLISQGHPTTSPAGVPVPRDTPSPLLAHEGSDRKYSAESPLGEAGSLLPTSTPAPTPPTGGPGPTRSHRRGAGSQQGESRGPGLGPHRRHPPTRPRPHPGPGRRPRRPGLLRGLAPDRAAGRRRRQLTRIQRHGGTRGQTAEQEGWAWQGRRRERDAENRRRPRQRRGGGSTSGATRGSFKPATADDAATRSSPAEPRDRRGGQAQRGEAGPGNGETREVGAEPEGGARGGGARGPCAVQVRACALHATAPPGRGRSGKPVSLRLVFKVFPLFRSSGVGTSRGYVPLVNVASKRAERGFAPPLNSSTY